jgi:hypothetical protein
MKGLLVVFIVLFSQYTFAQGISSVLDKSTNPGEVLVEFDNRSAEIKGSYYLFNEWQGGDLILNSGASINEQLLNYDVEYDLLEVKLADEVKIVPLSMLREFYILGKNDNKMLFLPCENYFYDQKIPMVGMCEVIDSNYYGLISRFDIDIKESTYIPAFDMGNREDELIVTKKLYLTKANKAIEIPKKKQSFIQLYPDRTDLSSFIKEHKLNPKNKDDLLIILDFLNEDQHFQ